MFAKIHDRDQPIIGFTQIKIRNRDLPPPGLRPIRASGQDNDADVAVIRDYRVTIEIDELDPIVLANGELAAIDDVPL